MTAPLADDYAGPFEPGWTPARLTRRGLARLAREVMLVSMFHDRALMPHIAVAAGQDATIAQADAEWMAASPLYTVRNKANLAIAGDGVPDAFKSFQFDVGAPHHFLDFHFEVESHDRGWFWLPFCGAHDYLREITRNDQAMVTNMCHHMEDRTFDATLAATNPRLRAVPAHRPPKPDAFTGDHCRWEVVVDGDASGARPAEPGVDVLRSTAAAGHEIALGDAAEPGGLADYAGEFRPDLRLEDLSHAALVRQVAEFALDVHILMRAAYLAVDDQHGSDLLDEIAPQHREAMAPAVVARLRGALGIDGDDMVAVAKMLQADPILVDGYLRYEVEVVDERHGRVTVDPASAAIGDDACRSPLTWLADDAAPGFDATVRAVNPQALVVPAGDLAWDIVLDAGTDPAPLHWAADMVLGGAIRTFDLTERPVTLRR